MQESERILEMTRGHSADLESDRSKFIGINEQPTIKYESRLLHICVNFLPGYFTELFPFGRDYHGFRILASFNRRSADGHLFFDYKARLTCQTH